MPLYHTMGIRSLIAMTMLNGTFVAMPRWHPAQALDILERERITHLYLAPTLYYDLLADPGIESHDLRALRKLGFAGAPMTPALVERCFARFSPEVFVNHYGSTEIYTFSINDDLRAKPASAGRAGINERLRVIDGEIVVHMSSPEAFSAYWNRPDAQGRAIRDGWYHTGDAGKIDDDGDLFVLGRVDDMIISGGENIYPAEIEDVLARCPAIGRIAVIGVPDERLGQKIVAFVEAARDDATEEELETYARSCGITQFKRPREYIFVRAIPQSPSGKILRTKLRAGEYERRGVSLRS
jgi:2-furoate---CoA ligase